MLEELKIETFVWAFYRKLFKNFKAFETGSDIAKAS